MMRKRQLTPISDLLASLRDVHPASLMALCISVATALAVGVSHLFWYWFEGYVPDGLTFVAAGVTFVVALPLLYVFVVAICQLRNSNAGLSGARTRLNLRNHELRVARDELERLNEELEIRVSERTAELEQALKLAQTASAAKSMFLANMSHELRTPLNGIIGYAEMIAHRDTLFTNLSQETIGDYAMAIQRSGRHLNSMVDDLLDLSMIEAEQVRIERRNVCIRDVLDAVVEELEPVARSRRQRISVDLPGEDYLCRTDGRALHQILTNLLSNALKYSDDGQCVSMRVDTEANTVRFLVSDRGIGMSPDAIASATEPFSRFSDAHIASGQSIGLGLSITKQLCEALGATMVIDSEEQVGTTVRVSIPDARPVAVPGRELLAS